MQLRPFVMSFRTCVFFDFLVLFGKRGKTLLGTMIELKAASKNGD